MNGKKKIALFSACYLPHLGGVERFTYNAAAALVERGNSVVVVTSNTDEAPSQETTDEGFEVVRLPCLSLLDGRLPIPLHNQEYRRLNRYISSMSIDGVLVNTRFYLHSLYGMKVARKNGITPVVLDHGSAYLSMSNAMIDFIIKKYEDSITAFGNKRYSPNYFAISNKSAEWLRHFGIQAKGLISNSIDANRYAFSASGRNFRSELGLGADTFIVTYVGRLINEKGILPLLEASTDQRIISKDLKIVIAGDGPLRNQVKESGENVIYLGRLCQNDIASLLLQSSLNCLPSRSEGFATTLLEASSCSCPSLVTDVGGARELIPNQNYGTILRDMSSETLVDEICRLYDNPELLSTQKRLCHEIVLSRFSWDSTAQAIEAALFH